MSPTYKRCVECDVVKPIEEFYRTASAGCTSRCKRCIDAKAGVRRVPIKTIAVLAMLLVLTIVGPAMAQAATTGSGSVWNLSTQNGNGANTTTFGPQENITIMAQPVKITVPGGRSVQVLGFNGSVLSNFYLGFFGISNVTGPTFNISFAIPQYKLQAGGILTIEVVNNLNGESEVSLNVSVQTDFNYLLQKQFNQLLSIFTGQHQILLEQNANLQAQVNTLTADLQMLGIAFFFLVAYVTRDVWMRREKKQVKEEETLLGAMMRQYVLERMEIGDRAPRKEESK